MVLGSHNAWSYAKPKKWWMELIGFTARCQKYDIRVQYEKFNVRCFDLRIRFNEDGVPMIVHGIVEYNIPYYHVEDDLAWLNSKGDCIVRVLLDTRSKKSYSSFQSSRYKKYCEELEKKYQNIRFCEGRNLYNWSVDYDFKNDITFEELYSSVCPPKIIDDWLPILYAKLYNKVNVSMGTNRDVLLIDFVNIQ